jgi:hypothetical protein
LRCFGKKGYWGNQCANQCPGGASNPCGGKQIRLLHSCMSRALLVCSPHSELLVVAACSQESAPATKASVVRAPASATRVRCVLFIVLLICLLFSRLMSLAPAKGYAGDQCQYSDAITCNGKHCFNFAIFVLRSTPKLNSACLLAGKGKAQTDGSCVCNTGDRR